MKNLLLLLLVLNVQNVFGQSVKTETMNTLQVDGSATLKITPDQVIINLGVELLGKELIPTKSKSDRIITNILNYCRQEGIQEKNIQTDYIHIRPRYDRNHYDNEYSTDVKYYDVSQSVTILLTDLSKYEKLMTTLIGFGVNNVKDVTFRSSKIQEYRKLVRKMAIDAAKEKALFLANEVDLNLGKVINISENIHNPTNSFSGGFSNVVMNHTVSNNNDTESLAAGMLSISASVYLTYMVK